MEQASLTIHCGFLLQWDPDIRRVAFEGFAEKSGGGDSNYSERMSLEDESGAHNGYIAGIGGLPEAVAQHDNWGSARFVVIGRDYPSAEGTHPKG
jgi:hypothetical protein